MKTCGRCGIDKPEEEFYRRAGQKGRLAWCAECCRVYARERSMVRRAEQRRTVIEHYGGECACCGETESAFLVLDHVNGGGLQHRKEIGKGRATSSDAVYRWIIKHGFPEGFQPLCANCNTAKERPGGCPHQRGLLPIR